MRRILTLFFALAGLAACQAEQNDLPPAPDLVPIYRLDSGDRLSLSVPVLPELNGSFEVASDGTIVLPLVGQVEARARSLGELAEEVRRRLGRDGEVAPRVRAEIILYRPIMVRGEVNRAGGFPYSPSLRVRQAIDLAGGFTRGANGDQLVVTRVDQTGPHRYRIGLEDRIHPGDIIEVQQKKL
jgi:polysaccharide export outer membrane protein